MPSGTGSSKLDLLAATTFGLEAVAARELEDLGYRAKPVGVGRVHFEGDHRAIVDANLWLRSADRVLVRVGEFPVGAGDPGFDQLFEGVRALAWEDWIAPGAAFPVAGRSVRSSITSEPAIQRATKRAIVERLRRAWGSRPAEILPENGPAVRVEVSILRDVATLTIDTSGVGLHKRGYREGSPGEAALRETLAAGLVLLSVWRPGRPLVDPFCGSGTIAIEAAMIGRNLAPGLARGFDCERWIDDRGGRLLDPDLWLDAREDARSAARPERLKPVVHASDIDDAALALARKNARAAGVELDIHFSKRDFAELSSSLEYGVVITNPPYGVRLGDEADVERLHRSMPAVFRRLPTWSFHILTGRLDTEDLFGQRATRRRKLYNATIQTTYFSFLGPQAGKDLEGLRELGGDSDGESDADERGEALDEGGALSENDAPPDQGSPLFPAPSPPSSFLAPVFGGLRERDEKEAGEFARALANNLRHLRRYPSRGITCYRVYERDVPDVPLIVDRYDDRFHAVEYEREHSRTPAQQADWFELMRSTIAKTAGVPLEHVYMKEKHRQRGLTQHEKVGAERATQVVSEGDPALRFEVNLSDYVDTGLFLDHRLTRQMVRERSRAKRLLNLFCYTGSFTVYAAAGGAASSVSVDLSNTYLDWANRNMALNMLGRAEHRFVRSGVLEFLDAHPPAGPDGAYDLMVVDPPTFSNSASTERDWDVQTSHVELLTKAARLLAPDGLVYFSTNFRRFKLDEVALASAGLSARDISPQTIPPEYRNRRIHACWIIRRSGIN